MLKLFSISSRRVLPFIVRIPNKIWKIEKELNDDGMREIKGKGKK